MVSYKILNNPAVEVFFQAKTKTLEAVLVVVAEGEVKVEEEKMAVIIKIHAGVVLVRTIMVLVDFRIKIKIEADLVNKMAVDFYQEIKITEVGSKTKETIIILAVFKIKIKEIISKVEKTILATEGVVVVETVADGLKTKVIIPLYFHNQPIILADFCKITKTPEV